MSQLGLKMKMIEQINNPKIDSKKCKTCGLCLNVCPYENIQQTIKGQAPVYFQNSDCIVCGHCVSVCPNGAISFPEIDMNQYIPIETKFDANNIEMLLKSKRSVRNFTNKQIDEKTIEHLINVSCHAPTSTNSESRKYLVIRGREKLLNIESEIIEGYKKFVKEGEKLGFPPNGIAMNRSHNFIKSHKSGGHPIFKTTSCLICIYDNEANPFSEFNCALASDYLMLQGHSQGIESYIVGVVLYDKEALSKLLNIPEGQKIYSAIALGYPSVKYKTTVSRKRPTIVWN